MNPPLARWQLLFPVPVVDCRHFRGPEQKLANQAERNGRHDHRQQARSEPAPRGHPSPIESSEQVIGENEKPQQGCHLVSVRAVAIERDGCFFSRMVRKLDLIESAMYLPMPRAGDNGH